MPRSLFNQVPGVYPTVLLKIDPGTNFFHFNFPKLFSIAFSQITLVGLFLVIESLFLALRYTWLGSLSHSLLGHTGNLDDFSSYEKK